MQEEHLSANISFNKNEVGEKEWGGRERIREKERDWRKKAGRKEGRKEKRANWELWPYKVTLSNLCQTTPQLKIKYSDIQAYGCHSLSNQIPVQSVYYYLYVGFQGWYVSVCVCVKKLIKKSFKENKSEYMKELRGREKECDYFITSKVSKTNVLL